MDDRRLERIEAKIDDQNEHLSSIDVTLMSQHASIKEHIRRTGLLENELRPIKRHVYMVQGALAFITLLATIVGIYSVIHGH